MSHDAYESDTGERDVPTPDNFITNTPVERRIVFPRGARCKALNRRCRAICRIMYAHDWSVPAICRIFGVSTTTVDRTLGEYRQHHPHDQPENDYYYAGEEYVKHFGPLENTEETVDEERKRKEEIAARAKTTLSTGRRVAKRPRYSSSPKRQILAPSRESSESESELSSSSSSSADTGSRSRSPSALIPSASRHSTTSSSATHVERLPTTTTSHRVKSPAGLPAPNLALFLKHTLCSGLPGANFSTPAHLELFAAQGFSVPCIHAIAQWPDEQLSEALRRLLLAREGYFGLDVFEVVMLEIAVRKLRCVEGMATSSSSNNIHTSRSLQAFLSAVHGLNLSPHYPLFVAQGYTLERLRALGVRYSWASSSTSTSTAFDPGELSKILQLGLQRRPGAGASTGMFPLEVVALEFALCAGAGAEH
ncbi:hypothetical protein C8F01DRAFT_1146990 [Mycena amicta]|nr:hypothetical protein C8F01DRAFT_1146990 [Mycena amicta]